MFSICDSKDLLSRRLKKNSNNNKKNRLTIESGLLFNFISFLNLRKKWLRPTEQLKCEKKDSNGAVVKCNRANEKKPLGRIKHYVFAEKTL